MTSMSLRPSHESSSSSGCRSSSGSGSVVIDTATTSAGDYADASITASSGSSLAAAAAVATSTRTVKKKKSLSARALKLLRSGLLPRINHRSISSAGTVLTAVDSVSSCCGCDDSRGTGIGDSCALSSSLRLPAFDCGVGAPDGDDADACDGDAGAMGGEAKAFPSPVADEASVGADSGLDDGGGDADDRDHRRDDSSDEGPTMDAADPERMKCARALHLRGRTLHGYRQYGEAVALYVAALEEMDERGHVGGGGAIGAGEDGAADKADVLRARIRYDLAGSRAAAVASRRRRGRDGSSFSTIDDVLLRRLTDDVRSSRTELHRAAASHLEGRVRQTSDPSVRADLLRSLGRLYDERLFEYDCALRCYGEALALEVRTAEELDRRTVAAVKEEAMGGTGSDEDQAAAAARRLREARRALSARADETRRMIGRLHYKRGEFGMAVKASFAPV